MFLRKLNIKLPYDPSVPFPGIQPDKTIIQKDTYTPMFIVTLFTMAKTWKQYKCPLTEENKEDVVPMYNGILLSHEKMK